MDGNTTFTGKGTLKVESNAEVSGNVDMSAVKPTVDSGKAITVVNGGSLKVDANTDGNLPAGKVEIAAGGSLTSMTTDGTDKPVTFVGPTEDARIKTESATKVEVEFKSDARSTMTITGSATIPAGQEWWAMFDSTPNSKGVDLTVKSGTLTVAGKMILSSADKNGSNLTVDSSAALKVAAGGTLDVRAYASLTGNSKVTGTDATSVLKVAKAAGGATFTGVAGIESRPSTTTTYTWDAAQTKWVAKT